MTKLEAWKAWCETTGTGDRLATEYTLENSSHGKTFSFAWELAHEECAKACEDAPEPDGRDLAERIRARSKQ